MGTVVVKRGRAKPLWRGHPWVFRDSIEQVSGDVDAGAMVQVADGDGRILGRGFWSPGSKIAVRLLSREPEGPEPDAAFFRDRIARAFRLRLETLGLPVVTDAYRLVHSEGDYLPGLIVDHFAGHLVVQLSTIGMHRRRDLVLDALEEVVAPASIFEQPDRKACEIEGIETPGGLLRGKAPPEPPSVLENGVCFRIGLGEGQKTGFFADQRDNRQLVGRLVRDRTVLDLHTYTGGFGLYAAVNGAYEVLGIDSSGPALALAAENAMLNNGRQIRFERGDAQETLNELHRRGRTFDVVICDPPRLAPDRASVPRALRKYRDLHLRAMRAVKPGGLLAVSSCSGAVREEEFERTLQEAAYDLKREAQVLHRGGQAADHPVLATCPEGRYLKFLLACVA
ncbi:MAG: class I SAM-dependent rRNA methyltransferase [Planctomycetes bacterium]|nr:class I SAM-dependent rRNA methyltransferase [Planctomycetota bacterium]